MTDDEIEKELDCGVFSNEKQQVYKLLQVRLATLKSQQSAS